MRNNLLKSFCFSAVAASALLVQNASADWISTAGLTNSIKYDATLIETSQLDSIKSAIFTDSLTEATIAAASDKLGKALDDALTGATAGVTLTDTIKAYKKLQAQKALNEIAADATLKDVVLFKSNGDALDAEPTKAQVKKFKEIFKANGIAIDTDVKTTLSNMLKSGGVAAGSFTTDFKAKNVDTKDLEKAYNDLVAKITAKQDNKAVKAAIDELNGAMEFYKAYSDVLDQAAEIKSGLNEAQTTVLGAFNNKTGYEDVLNGATTLDQLKENIKNKATEYMNTDAEDVTIDSSTKLTSLSGKKLSINQAIEFLESGDTTDISNWQGLTNKNGAKTQLQNLKNAIDGKGNIDTTEVKKLVTLFDDKIALTSNLIDQFAAAAKVLEDNRTQLTDENIAAVANANNEIAALIAGLKSFSPNGIVAKEQAVKNLGSLNVSESVLKDFVAAIVTEDGNLPVMKNIIENATKEDASDTDKKLLSDLKSAANKVAAAIVESEKDEIAAQALGALNIQINNMNKRLGEVRGLDGEIGAWIRANGGRYSTDDQKYNFYSTQIGADKMLSNNDGDFIVGALFGYDYSKGDAKTKTYSVGVYGSFIDNSGAFADVVLKYAQAKHSQDNWDYKKQNMFLASFEGGYRFDIDDSSYFEPSLEFITGYVGKFKANTGSSEITVDSFMPLVLKPQVYFGKSVDDFTFRVGVGGVFNFKKNEADININDLGIDGLNAYASTKLDRNSHGFASIGGAYKFNENLRFNLAVERSFGGNLTKDYEINATLRYTF